MPPPVLASDALRRLGERFARHQHVVAAGVKQGSGVAHHADMALPEHEIAAPQRRIVGQLLAK